MKKAFTLERGEDVSSGPIRLRQWWYNFRGKKRLAMTETSLGRGDARTSFLFIKPGCWIFPKLGPWEYHEFVVDQGSVSVGEERYMEGDGITFTPGEEIFVEAQGIILAG